MAILMRLGPREEPLVGDLVEEYTTGRSRLWFWRQALAAVAAGAIRGVRDQPLRRRSCDTGLGGTVTGIRSLWRPRGERTGKPRVGLGSPDNGVWHRDLVAVPNLCRAGFLYRFRDVGMGRCTSAPREPGDAARVCRIRDRRPGSQCGNPGSADSPLRPRPRTPYAVLPRVGHPALSLAIRFSPGAAGHDGLWPGGWSNSPGNSQKIRRSGEFLG